MADAPATATSSSASRRRGAEVPYLPLLFSLTERIDSLPIGILDFEQLENESIGAA